MDEQLKRQEERDTRRFGLQTSTIPLYHGRMGYLKLPPRLSSDDWAMILAFLELVRSAVVVDDPPEAAPDA